MNATAVRPLRNEADYAAALREVDRLIDSDEDSDDADILEVLSVLVADYEDRHHAIEPPDPISFLEFVMESRGLTLKDLEPYIGSSARVTEVMGRTNPLTIEMVRQLCNGLDLPAEVLIQPYSVAQSIGTTDAVRS